MPAPTPPRESILARSRGPAEIQHRAACRPARSSAMRPKRRGRPPPTCPLGSSSPPGAARRRTGLSVSPRASSGSAAKRPRSAAR
eukprot:404911-Lingulodinium_polyedra.AAC.1